MKRSTQVLVVGLAALALGGVAGYGARGVLGGGDAPAAPSAEDAGGKPKGKIADGGEAASVRALRARVRDLERQLAELSAADSNAVEQAVAEQPRGHEDFHERMERMKTEDPARYAEITNNMARWRQQRSERQMAKLDFLSSIDTSRMSPQAKAVHEQLQDAIARQEELESQMHDESLTEEGRRQLWNQMRENGRQLWALNGKERNNLIETTARNLGFKGQEVREISTTMREIIEATDSGFGGPGGHHGGRPPAPR